MPLSCVKCWLIRADIHSRHQLILAIRLNQADNFIIFYAALVMVLLYMKFYCNVHAGWLGSRSAADRFLWTAVCARDWLTEDLLGALDR